MNHCPKCYGTGYRYIGCTECQGNSDVWCASCGGAGQVIENCKCGSQMAMQSDNNASGKTESYGDYRDRRSNVMS